MVPKPTVPGKFPSCLSGAKGDWGKRRNGEECTLQAMGWSLEKCTHAVALKEPNAWGFFDMHGNVWELCEDLYEGGFSRRVNCGGCWDSDARGCSAPRREYTNDRDHRHLGFRLAADDDVTDSSMPHKYSDCVFARPTVCAHVLPVADGGSRLGHVMIDPQ